MAHLRSILCISLAFACLLCISALADDAPATQSSDDVVTGEFQTSFTARSPLSTPVELTRRFGIKPPEHVDDYDISAIQWNVFVPVGYDAANPPGMIATFGNPVPMTAALKSFCNSKYLMFLSTTPTPSVPTRQAGLLLDAVTNMGKRYSMDKNRLYFLDVYDEEYVAYAVQDVYTGFIVINKLFYPGRLLLRQGNGFMFFPPPSPHPMDAGLMKLARTRAFAYILTNEIPPSDGIVMVPEAMQANGFLHVKKMRTARDGVFYPNIDIAWFKDAVAYLETSLASQRATATPPAPDHAASDQPATRPSAAPASAQTLFAVANACINSGATDLAKQKLNELIEKYPTDPLADQARKLLDQLNNP